jgi:hypothetical protein
MNGLPSFSMVFKELSTTAVERSERGVVGIILRDETDISFTTKTLYDATGVSDTEWTEGNQAYLNDLAFRGTPFKVVIYRIGLTETDLTAATTYFKQLEPNYVAMPAATTDEVTTLVSWVSAIRSESATRPSTVKLVVAGALPDKEYIVDLDNSQTYTIDDVTYTAQEYSLCIAGMAAGVSLNSSLTYYKMSWLDSCTTIDDEETAVQAGKIVTTYDGAYYKVMRGVTSFITATDEKGKSFSKIRLMEIMDLHKKDIRDTYDDYYLGKYQNIYTNKMRFAGAVNAYLSEFVKDGQLDSANENKLDVDIDANKTWCLANGKYTEEELAEMDDYTARRVNTGDDVLMKIEDYKPTDVMEDMTIEVYL